MTAMRKSLFIFVILGISGCTSKYAQFVNIKPGIDPTVVLVNASEYNRSELAEILTNLKPCEPAVVAIKLLFVERRGEEDHKLASAIKKCERVILAENFDAHGRSVKSNPIFLDSALSSGIVSGFLDEDGVFTEFEPLYEDYQGKKDSFAAEIAFAFFPTSDLYTKFHIQESRPVTYVRDLDNFKLIDPTNFRCEDVRDKIVIIGYLGPDDSENHITALDMVKGNNTKTYTTVTIANEVLNILDVLGYRPGQTGN